MLLMDFFPLNVWIRQKQEPNGYFLILVTQVISEGQLGGGEGIIEGTPSKDAVRGIGGWHRFYPLAGSPGRGAA